MTLKYKSCKGRFTLAQHLGKLKPQAYKENIGKQRVNSRNEFYNLSGEAATSHGQQILYQADRQRVEAKLEIVGMQSLE